MDVNISPTSANVVDENSDEIVIELSTSTIETLDGGETVTRQVGDELVTFYNINGEQPPDSNDDSYPTPASSWWGKLLNGRKDELYWDSIALTDNKTLRVRAESDNTSGQTDPAVDSQTVLELLNLLRDQTDETVDATLDRLANELGYETVTSTEYVPSDET